MRQGKSSGRMFGEANAESAPPHRNGSAKKRKPQKTVRLNVVTDDPGFSFYRCDYCGTNYVNGFCPAEGDDYPHPPKETR